MRNNPTATTVDGHLVDLIAVQRAIAGHAPRPYLTRWEYHYARQQLLDEGMRSERVADILTGLRYCMHDGCRVRLPDDARHRNQWLCADHATREVYRMREQRRRGRGRKSPRELSGAA